METYKEKVIWYDIVSPTAEDLKFVEEEFRMHPVILAELKVPSQRSRVEILDHYMYLVIHFPFFDPEKKTSRPIEIDIVATRDKVATIRYATGGPMDDFALKCEGVAGFKSHCLGDTTGEFIYRLFEYIFEYSLRELQHVDTRLNAIEENLFRGREKELIQEISLTKRDVLDFRRIIIPMKSILESLSEKGKKFYGEGMAVYLFDLMGDYLRIMDTAENFKDTIESLETTNQALLSSRIDEVMRILSILAFLLAPFTIIGALFQVNTTFTPILGTPGDWWIIFFLMMLGSLALYLWFRKKKWL